jgi:hypothetical protein
MLKSSLSICKRPLACSKLHFFFAIHNTALETEFFTAQATERFDTATLPSYENKFAVLGVFVQFG